ncbi:MAG: hypothetical protein NUV32_02005 [Exilispira sp.]|nr:hypothetical protein [Exilispira sp.]
MVKKKEEKFPLFKQYLYEDFNRVIYQYVFYRFLIIFLLYLLAYSFLRLISLTFNIRYYIIFVFYYFSMIFSLLVFFIGNFNNYLGKFLRLIDIKTIYETYMVIKRKNKITADYFSSILEDNASNNGYKRLNLKLKWKTLLIILFLFLIIFGIGSIFSFYQYGKVVYKVVPFELKEVLTMQSIVEKLLEQLDEDSDQYKFLSNLYEEATYSYTKHGINQKEYLERLNQILQQSTSLGESKNLQSSLTSSSSSSNAELDKGSSKEKKDENQSSKLVQKYKKQMEDDEKNQPDSKTKVLTAGENMKQNFLDFLKTQFSHPENPKAMGPAGYESQDIKSLQNPSVDFSTMLESIYANSSEFSYSLSNQLTQAQKIEIFNYLVKQFNISSSTISFDEELFYKLILLYLEQMNQIQTK